MHGGEGLTPFCFFVSSFCQHTTHPVAAGVSASDVGADGSEEPRLSTGRREGAHGGGNGQPGSEGGGHQAHGAVDPVGGHMGGPGVHEHVPVKRQQGNAHNRERHARPCVTCRPRRRAQGHNRREPPKEGRQSRHHRETGRPGRRRATAASGRDPTRGPTSREGGRRRGGRQAGAQGLATQN